MTESIMPPLNAKAAVPTHPVPGARAGYGNAEPNAKPSGEEPNTAPVPKLKEPPSTAPKPRGRPFEAGNKFGQGRPRGSLNKNTLLMQSLWNEHGPEVAEKVIAKAKAGDPNAMKIVMDRIAPIRPGVPLPWNMPVIRHADDIRPAYSALSQAVSDGELSVIEGLHYSRFLESVAKVFNVQTDLGLVRDIDGTVER